MFSLLQGTIVRHAGQPNLFPVMVDKAKDSESEKCIGDGNQVLQFKHCNSILFTSAIADSIQAPGSAGVAFEASNV